MVVDNWIQVLWGKFQKNSYHENLTFQTKLTSVNRNCERNENNTDKKSVTLAATKHTDILQIRLVNLTS